MFDKNLFTMDDKLVTIATHTFSRAQILKVRLEAAGIDCFLANMNVIRPTVPAGVKVKIKEQDIEQATEIALQLKDEFDGISVDIQEDIERILVPVVFDDYSLNACKFAISLAEKLGAEVKLIHIYYDPVVASLTYADTESYPIHLNVDFQEIEIKAKENMNLFLNTVRDYIKKQEIENVEIKHELVRGIVKQSIVGMSNIYKPGAIIMGFSNKDKSSGHYIGSVTSYIIEKTEVPVLAIPGRSYFRGLRHVNIMYATNFEDSDYVAIRKLISLIYLFDVTIYCVHISSKVDAPLDKAKMAHLKRHFDTEYSGFEVRCDIVKGDNIIQSIEEFIVANKIEIIAMTTRKRNILLKLFNPSITKQVLFHTGCPLLVFHT
jgi:nucleotide-binding universal stress UspA family protein